MVLNVGFLKDKSSCFKHSENDDVKLNVWFYQRDKIRNKSINANKLM